MKKFDCLLCSFENPRLTVTAIFIRDNKVLVAKRKEAPYKGEWDFIGGYVEKEETPDDALRREVREELGISCKLQYIGSFTGTSFYKDYEFPILSMAYLAEGDEEIKLNEENSEIQWVPLASLHTIAFDSNQKILAHLKEKFVYDIARVRELVSQLDPSATLEEQSLYKAMLCGFVSQIKEEDKLMGMGWIFPRQTMLRRQAIVEDMIVDQTQRGRGLGEKILRDLLSWAKEQGIEMVELTTNPKRVAANALYQKIGFKLHPTNHYLLDLATYEATIA